MRYQYAKKHYHCGHCGGDILKGELYGRAGKALECWKCIGDYDLPRTAEYARSLKKRDNPAKTFRMNGETYRILYGPVRHKQGTDVFIATARRVYQGKLTGPRIRALWHGIDPRARATCGCSPPEPGEVYVLFLRKRDRNMRKKNKLPFIRILGRTYSHKEAVFNPENKGECRACLASNVILEPVTLLCEKCANKKIRGLCERCGNFIMKDETGCKCAQKPVTAAFVGESTFCHRQLFKDDQGTVYTMDADPYCTPDLSIRLANAGLIHIRTADVAGVILGDPVDKVILVKH
jgi:hypothetical protein